MYFEEPVEDLTITVEGEDYQAEPTVDLDDDGIDDTAVVETDDGSISFTDTDSDGQADLMTRLDADGEVVGQARFDQSTGEWVQVDPDDIERTTGSGGTMTADTAEGEIELGAPTHDTDADGKADSVVVQERDGDTVIFTDSDEDGDADYATAITEHGQVTISEHTGDGDWTVIERGHLEDDGSYQRDPATHTESGTISEDDAWTATQPGQDEVRVDPRSGGWVRG